MSSVSPPITPTKTAVFRQVERKPSSMSATTQSRPVSSSSAGPAPGRSLSRASTSLGLTRSASAGTKAVDSQSVPMSSISSVSSAVTVTANGPITPVTPTMSISPVSSSSSGDAPAGMSLITPSTSMYELQPNSTMSLPMTTSYTPPMGSIALAATARGAAAKADVLASHHTNNNHHQRRSLKSILQNIIDSVDEVRIRESEMEDIDGMLLEISELKAQLEATTAEFFAYRELMDAEMSNYKEKKERELKAFRQSKENELNMFKTNKTREIDEYKSKKEQEVRRFKQTKESELVLYKAGRAKEMEDIKASKAAEIAQLATAKANAIAELTATKTTEIDELKAAQMAEIDKLKATHAKQMEEATAALQNELEETRHKSEEEIDKLRTERDIAVHTKESLKDTFEERFAEWDISTSQRKSDTAQIEKLEAELKKALDRAHELDGSLNALRATHEKCAVKDNEFTSKTNGLTMEVAAMMVKSKLKTKEANEAKKQATEYKRRYEKCQNRLGMLTLDTEDIATKFCELDNSFHDLVGNFFDREIPDTSINLSGLPGDLWGIPQVHSNSQAARCLRAALAEAIVSYILTTRIFQQFYIPEDANIDFRALYQVLRWMDGENAEQAQVIRCQIAMVCERFPEIVSIPTTAAAEVCDLLHPWLDTDSACKAFQNGLTQLMQRAMAIWQQMQRGSQLARAISDKSGNQWLAAAGAREKYSKLTGDTTHTADSMAATNSEPDEPVAVLFPQIHFGSEICFSGHALFPTQSCVVAARAERIAANPSGSAGRRRPNDVYNHPVSLPPSSSGPAIAAQQAAQQAALHAAAAAAGSHVSPTTTEHVGSSAASISSTTRPPSRQSVQSRFSDGMCSSLTSPSRPSFPLVQQHSQFLPQSLDSGSMSTASTTTGSSSALSPFSRSPPSSLHQFHQYPPPSPSHSFVTQSIPVIVRSLPPPGPISASLPDSSAVSATAPPGIRLTRAPSMPRRRTSTIIRCQPAATSTASTSVEADDNSPTNRSSTESFSTTGGFSISSATFASASQPLSYTH